MDDLEWVEQELNRIKKIALPSEREIRTAEALIKLKRLLNDQSTENFSNLNNMSLDEIEQTEKVLRGRFDI